MGSGKGLPAGFRAADPREAAPLRQGMPVRDKVRADVLALVASGEAAMARDYPDVPSARRDAQRYRDAVRYWQKRAKRRGEKDELEGVGVYQRGRTMVIAREDAV